MRWSGQAVGADDAAALPALARRADLVRSVQTPEFAGITFHEVLAKSALNHVPGAGSALPFGWTINPFRGCSHACSFCFARPTHEYLEFDAGRDFDTQIVVKVNVGEVVERELARPSWARAHVALGTNTDPYQRAEGRYRLMPGVIAALAASGTPFSILTKGTLLRRDLPLLQAAAERVPVQVAMTIAVFDGELAGSVESGAPTAEARLVTVRAARDAGFAPTVFLMPVLPFLTDSAGQLDRALARIAEAGAASVAYSALHLRPGAKEWFFDWLGRERPELVPRYRQLYAESAYAPGEYRRALAARIRPLLRRHGLDRPAVDPSTGIAASPELTTGSRFSAVAATALGAASPRTADGVGALAAELSPAAAAALQPTLF
ncbi:MAG: Rv2578c family radical SAM protein [Actinomycetales bacterium]|nr:Rv2578c family radical SAM protein [Actinomycetales bacterium]